MYVSTVEPQLHFWSSSFLQVDEKAPSGTTHVCLEYGGSLMLFFQL